MKSQFRHVALFGRTHASITGAALEGSRKVLEEVAHFLTRQGCEVVFDQNTAQLTGLSGYAALDLPQIGQQCDLGIAIGGDGTMLGVGRCVFDALAMNDVVVYRGGTSGMVELRVEVDGHFVANQRADGLIIATPTGSTAYSLSVGGSLMHPAIGGWIMAPIAPHTLSNRPIVLSDNSEVSIEIVSGRYASANFDMQSLASLMIGDRITVRRSQHQVRFLHPEGWNYFDTLRKKMHWNEGA